MISGISGSGKSCLSKKLELFGIPRISIDGELWPDYYVCPGLLSEEHLDFLYSEAIKRIKSKIHNFCAEGKSCSVDMPFCKKAQRDMFRAHIIESGGEPVLIWINTDLPVLKERLSDRKGKSGPDNLPVSEEEIGMYWRGFERPKDEQFFEIDGNKPFDIDEILKMI